MVNAVFVATREDADRVPNPLQSQIGVDHMLFPVLKHFADHHVEITSTTRVLTDDFAPVEWMSDRALGNLLRDGLEFLKIRGIYALRNL